MGLVTFVRELLWVIVETLFHAFVAAVCVPLAPFMFIVQWCRAARRQRFSSILITGGNSGLGEALALSFAAPGVQLVLLARDEAKLAAVAAQCRERGAAVELVAASVTDRARMESELLRLDTLFKFDCVIANAGVSTGTLGESKLEDSTYALFDINVNGVFNTIFPLLARMRDRKRGQVGLMSSLASFVPLPVACEYHASKAAVRFFAEGLRPLCAPDNVGITALCPGFVRTPLTDITRRNNRTLPFFIDNAGTAADIMRDALERNVGVCVFPNELYLLSSLGSWLPLPVREWVLSLSTGGPKLAAARLRAPSGASTGGAGGSVSSEVAAAKVHTPRRK